MYWPQISLCLLSSLFSFAFLIHHTNRCRLFLYIYTLIHSLFTARDGLPSACTLVFTVVLVLWLLRPYRCHNHITEAHQKFANHHSQLQTFSLCVVVWHHPQIMMICSSMLNRMQVSPDYYFLVNLPGPTILPSKTTERSHYNPSSSCMHKNTRFGFLTTRLTPSLKGTGLSFGKLSIFPTHVWSWSVIPDNVTPFSLSIHSLGLRPMGQSPCILGLLLVCSDTLEQLLLGNQYVLVAQPPWQKLALFLSLSRVLVDGVLLLSSGISERIL